MFRKSYNDLLYVRVFISAVVLLCVWMVQEDSLHEQVPSYHVDPGDPIQLFRLGSISSLSLLIGPAFSIIPNSSVKCFLLKLECQSPFNFIHFQYLILPNSVLFQIRKKKLVSPDCCKLYFYLYVDASISVFMCSGYHRGQKRPLNLLELELTGVVKQPRMGAGN